MRTAASKLLLVLAAVAAVVSSAAAQYITPIAQSARSGALGGSLLYFPGEQCVAIDYRRGFMLAALADKTVRLQMAAGARGTALAAYSHHGDAMWHEQQAVVGYGLQAAEWLHVAVAARWLQRGVGDAHYESRQWLAPSALVQTFFGNTSLTLLGGTRPWDSDRPWRWHLQAAYRPLPQWTAVAEWEGEERTRMRLGMEYAYDGSWFLRAGMATRPVVLIFGIGARRRHWSADLAVEVHSVLGITPQTSLSLWF